MMSSSNRTPKVRAVAKVLAMIADADPNLLPNFRRPVLETDEWLWATATEFCAALDRYTVRARGGLKVVPCVPHIETHG